MEERSWKETLQVEGGQMLEQVKRLIHEGNVRRIVIKQGAHTVVELPLTLGVMGLLVTPMLAAVGAAAALLTDCSIEVERLGEAPTDKPADEKKPGEPPADAT